MATACAPLDHARRLLVVAVAATALASSASAAPVTSAAPPALDPHIGFADPAMCYFTDETEKLVGGLIAYDPEFMHEEGWIQPGAVPERLRDRLGPIALVTHDGWWTIRTEARGTLWGLPLSAIEQILPVGGDPGGITFVFDAPVEAVGRAARERGFVARAGQSVPMGEPDGYAYEITLRPHPDDERQSLLSCDYS